MRKITTTSYPGLHLVIVQDCNTRKNFLRSNACSGPAASGEWLGDLLQENQPDEGYILFDILSIHFMACPTELCGACPDQVGHAHLSRYQHPLPLRSAGVQTVAALPSSSTV